MAGQTSSNKAAAAVAPTSAVEQDEFAKLFAGDKAYERIDVPEVQGWFKPVPGAFFYGRIISHFQIEDKKNGKLRDILVLRLGADCKNVVMNDRTEGTLAKNGVLAVGVTHKLRPLLEYVANKGVGGARALEKKSIGGGQTMWTYEISFKGVKAAPPASAILSNEEATAATGTKFDDIPF